MADQKTIELEFLDKTERVHDDTIYAELVEPIPVIGECVLFGRMWKVVDRFFYYGRAGLVKISFYLEQV